MGKEWLYYLGGGGNGGGGGGSKSSSSAKKQRSGGNGGGGGGGGGEDREATTPGCMCAVFQLFDLHHFQFPPLNHQQTTSGDHFLHLQDEPSSTILKGVEAPRNSLELEEGIFVEAPSSLPAAIIKEEDSLNIPMGIQIRTSCENRSPRTSTSSNSRPPKLGDHHQDPFSECSSTESPGGGAKTPSLVARLMGLDLLPESSGSPCSFSKKQKQQEHQKQQPIISSSSRQQFRRINKNSNILYENELRGGSVSLPETPRISSASSRRSTDHVDTHRLSLQIIGEDLEVSAKKNMGRRRDISIKVEDIENRSPGGGNYYARNIVKQVKESVSRKVGGLHDISNTLKNRGGEQQQQRRDSHLVVLKPNKKSFSSSSSSVDDSISPSCSPRFRFLDPNKNKTSNSHSPRLSPLSSENQSSSSSQVVHEKTVLHKTPVPVLLHDHHHHHQQQQQQQQQQKSVQNFKKAEVRRKPITPANSDAIRNKKSEEPFVRSTTTNKGKGNNISDKNKCKRTTPLSNQLLPVRKDSSLPLTNLRDHNKQSQEEEASDALSWKRSSSTPPQLSSCSSHSYKKKEEMKLSFQEKNTTSTNKKDDKSSTSSSSSIVDEMEFQYIKIILKRTGLIHNSTPLSLANWFSPSHPLQPSIFHYMELFHSTTVNQCSRLSHRCNRKLIFQLVNELLVEILKPYINPKPWIRRRCGGGVVNRRKIYGGAELIEEICRKIKNFPLANCQVLEDIDGLIDGDLRKSDVGLIVSSSSSSWSWEDYEEVGERIALEIEREIMEKLVHETTATLVFGMEME